MHIRNDSDSTEELLFGTMVLQSEPKALPPLPRLRRVKKDPPEWHRRVLLFWDVGGARVQSESATVASRRRVRRLQPIALDPSSIIADVAAAERVAIMASFQPEMIGRGAAVSAPNVIL